MAEADEGAGQRRVVRGGVCPHSSGASSANPRWTRRRAWTQRVRPEACHLTLTGAPLRPLVRSGRPSPALPGFVSAVFTPKVPARPLHVRSAQYIIRERGQATGAGVRILRAAGSPKRAHPFTEDAGSRTWPEPCRTPEEAEGTAWAFVVCATGDTRP